MQQPELTPGQTADIRNAVDTMRRGGVILYPTDTVWGIGCDATDSEAVRRVFAIKHRADAKALITLVPSMAALERIVDPDCIADATYQLLDVATEPLTVVYDRGIAVAPELLADDGSIGVRVTAEPFSQALCAAMRGPVVSTSANISGAPTPLCFADISPEIIDAVDYVCLSRRDEPRAAKSSTVIKISADGTFVILRK